tara:strand:+ start:107 stop:856 length:750 start_codon:yes stop_codon:yes gene_type:complete
MKKDVVNLADTIQIFKKNIKGFYLSLVTGIVIGLLGVFINTNFIEKKTVIKSIISIKNPLENYLVLDLFSLDTIQIDEKVSITSTQEKIKNYYAMTKEYLELISSTIDIGKYDIDEKKYGYKIETQISENDFSLIIRNISNPEKVLDNLNKMTADFNKIIKPLVLKNLLIETKFIENFLEISSINPESQKLSILIDIRKETLESFKDQKFEIFDLSSSQDNQVISNKRIVLVSVLLSLSMFLMFIILKK